MKRLAMIVATLLLAGCGTAEDERRIRTLLDERERAVEVTPAPSPTAEAGFGVSEAVLVSISEVEDVDVDGDRARARYDDGFVQRLRKVDGRWIIEGEEQIRRTLEADEAAGDRKDWAAMCALRTAAARAVFPLCADFATKASRDAPLGNEAILTFQYDPGRVTAVAVDGDRATVNHDSGQITHLRKVRGRWLIDA